MDLSKLLPDESDGWAVRDEIEAYDRESIFTYMNGAGEVYRMYAYREMLVARMARGGQPDITIELFDMTTPQDAYGIFSHSRSAEESVVGQGASYQAGLLCFWKSRYFVCVRADEETPETREAVYAVARRIADLIPGEGPRPVILQCLPEDCMDENSIRYFHLHTSLNYHYYLADRNILNLDENTEAVLAACEPDGSVLVCIRYPDAVSANDALVSFTNEYIPEADESGMAMLEDGKWTAVASEREFLILVLGSQSRDLAVDLRRAAESRVSQMRERELETL